jgi:pantothenate kinase
MSNITDIIVVHAFKIKRRPGVICFIAGYTFFIYCVCASISLLTTDQGQGIIARIKSDISDIIKV